MTFPMLRRHGRLAGVMLTLAFVAVAAPSEAIQARRTPTADDAYLSIEALRQAYALGELTPLDMTLLFQQRIDSIDRAGPTLRSVLETNPDAAVAAHAARRAYLEGHPQPLAGIPILLKDNIQTGDRMRTTAGSLAFERPALYDATVVSKLREAGAVILGKANLSEWANFRGSDSVNGWSARGGRTRHPYVLDLEPRGSSAGSTTAVAAGLATASLATGATESIIYPAEGMGLVGIKPTVGLVSRAGIIPVSRETDSVGPIARSVADAAAVLTVIAGSDPADPMTAEADRHATDYTRFLDLDGVRGKRIGVVHPADGDYDPSSVATERAIAILRENGAIVVDHVRLPALTTTVAGQIDLTSTEFKRDITAYLATRTEQPLRTLEDLIAFNERERSRELAEFGQELFVLAKNASRTDDPGYVEQRLAATREAGPDGIDAVSAFHDLDALIGPLSMMRHSSLAGYPSITLPTHFEGPLPVGVMLFGTKWSEPTLISIAAAIEKESAAFRPPRFLPPLTLD